MTNCAASWSHLVISTLNNKCVSLAAHNVDLRDEEAVDVPVGEEYNFDFQTFRCIFAYNSCLHVC